MFLVVSFRFVFAYQTNHQYKDGESVSLSIRILSDIDTYSSHPSITVSLPDSFPSQRATVLFPLGTTVHYGQYVTITGRLSAKQLPAGTNQLSMHVQQMRIQATSLDWLFGFLFMIRESVIQRYHSVLSDIDCALLLGIVFGIKEQVSTAFSQLLQNTGVTHVISASGMNVTMVGGFLLGVFGRFLHRKVALSICIAFLLLYAVFAGLQPSILRATIMEISAFSAQLIGRQYKSWYILSLSGWIMLITSPQLLFDIGFQLSFLSTLGIIIIQPFLTKIPLITEDIATTTAAQIATIPVLVATFGQYSLVSILVNGLVLWTVPPLMVIGGIGAMIGMIIPVLGNIFLYTAIPFLWFFETIVSFFANMQLMVKASNQNTLLTIGYYLIVIAILIWIKRRRDTNSLSE